MNEEVKVFSAAERLAQLEAEKKKVIEQMKKEKELAKQKSIADKEKDKEIIQFGDNLAKELLRICYAYRRLSMKKKKEFCLLDQVQSLIGSAEEFAENPNDIEPILEE